MLERGKDTAHLPSFVLLIFHSQYKAWEGTRVQAAEKPILYILYVERTHSVSILSFKLQISQSSAHGDHSSALDFILTRG